MLITAEAACSLKHAIVSTSSIAIERLTPTISLYPSCMILFRKGMESGPITMTGSNGTPSERLKEAKRTRPGGHELGGRSWAVVGLTDCSSTCRQ